MRTAEFKQISKTPKISLFMLLIEVCGLLTIPFSYRRSMNQQLKKQHESKSVPHTPHYSL